MTESNLKPFNSLTEKEQRKIASAGGKASVEARRRKKTMRKQLELLMSLPLVGEENKKKIKKMGINQNEIDNQMAITVALFQQALKGNTKAYKIIRDTLGETIVQEQKISFANEIENAWKTRTKDE